MAELPYMPVYWEKIFGDIGHLSTEEKGAYLLLLGSMWLKGGRLVDDEDELRLITGLSKHKFRKSREKIFRFFTRLDGYITQKRLTDSMLKVREKRRKNAEAAQRRWGMQTHSERNANQSQTKTLSFFPGVDSVDNGYVPPQQRSFNLPVDVKRSGNR